MIKRRSSKTKHSQRPGFLIVGSIIFAGAFAVGPAAVAGNMKLPEQNMISSNALDSGGAAQQTQSGSQTALRSPNASDVTAEIGDDALATPRATVDDFNGDGHPDYVLRNAGTRQTAIWFLDNNIFLSGAFGPTITTGWLLKSVADFNRDMHPDYALFNASTDRTGIWYLSGPNFIGSAFGPTLPDGWELIETGDFNDNGFPDYVLFNATTHQTAIWYLNNNVFVSGAFGPTLPVGWNVVGIEDFDGDSHEDYLLFN